MKLLLIELIAITYTHNVQAKSIAETIKDFFNKIVKTGNTPCIECQESQGMPVINEGELTCQELTKYEKGQFILNKKLQKRDIPGICKEFLQDENISRSNLDWCLDNTKNRYSDTFVPPSAEELQQTTALNEPPWLLASIEKLEERTYELRKQALGWKKSCCGQDLECLSLINTVDIFYCNNPEARADPTLPDRCSTLATFYYDDNLLDELTSVADNPKTPLREQINTLGEIDFSPYYKEHEKGDIWMDSPLTMAHEYGHACSVVKLVQSLKSKNSKIRQVGLAYLQEMIDLDYSCESEDKELEDQCIRERQKKDCEITNAKLNFNRYRAQDSGEILSKKVIDCVSGLGTEGENVCPLNCPSYGLEESYSNLVALSAYPAWGYEEFCFHTRDSQHPFGMDELDCVAKYSPGFREVVRGYWACQ